MRKILAWFLIAGGSAAALLPVPWSPFVNHIKHALTLPLVAAGLAALWAGLRMAKPKPVISLGLAALIGLALLREPWSWDHWHDFSPLYAASKLLLRGNWELYSPPPPGLIPEAHPLPYVYHPLVAVFLLPLALLPYPIAGRLFLLLGFASFIGAGLLLVRKGLLKPHLLPLWTLGWALTRPLAHCAPGQVSLFVPLLVLLALGNGWWLGLLQLTKPLPLLWLLYIRQPKELLKAVGLYAALSLPFAPLIPKYLEAINRVFSSLPLGTISLKALSGPWAFYAGLAVALAASAITLLRNPKPWRTLTAASFLASPYLAVHHLSPLAVASAGLPLWVIIPVWALAAGPVHLPGGAFGHLQLGAALLALAVYSLVENRIYPS